MISTSIVNNQFSQVVPLNHLQQISTDLTNSLSHSLSDIINLSEHLSYLLNKTWDLQQEVSAILESVDEQFHHSFSLVSDRVDYGIKLLSEE